MLLGIFIAAYLAQAQSFLEFKVCFLDFNATPWEFRPHPQEQIFYARRDQIIYISEVDFEAGGLECVKVCSAHGCKFIIGGLAEVMSVITGARDQ